MPAMQEVLEYSQSILLGLGYTSTHFFPHSYYRSMYAKDRFRVNQKAVVNISAIIYFSASLCYHKLKISYEEHLYE
jgi:hypothetical protein